MMAYATRFNTFFVLSVENLLYCTVQKKATFKHTKNNNNGWCDLGFVLETVLVKEYISY